MTKPDVLSHPDLRKAWVAIELAAPSLQWEDLIPSETVPSRPRLRVRRLLAVAALALLVVFVGSEFLGVFAARRAIASGSAVLAEPIRLDISSQVMADPETVFGSGDSLITSDLAVTSSMITALIGDLSDPDAEWRLARLTGDGWQRLNVDLDHVLDSTVVSGREFILGFRDRSVLIDGHPTTERDYVIYEIGPDSDQPVELHVFENESGHFQTIAGSNQGLVAISHTDNTFQIWESADGETWVEGESFTGRVNSATASSNTILFAGLELGLLSFEELGSHAVWTLTADGRVQTADISGMRSLGFGYILGGFRVSDGLRDVIQVDDGYVAYSETLQVWDGWDNGVNLEPSEAWSSLVVTSTDGASWEAHLLPDFAISQIVPYGNGLLATAGRTPESDTQMIEDEDGTIHEVAVSPPKTLYYSEDGLTWRPVENSPEFSKPLLVQTKDGDVVAVDEHAVEDRDNNTTRIHILTAP